MLGKYITINSTLMPNPAQFEYTYPPDETVYTSEAGTQLTNVRRLDRLTFKAEWHCSSRLRDQLLVLCKTPSVSVSIDGATPVSGRLRLAGGPKLVEDSENTNGTQGLWVVSTTFEGE